MENDVHGLEKLTINFVLPHKQDFQWVDAHDPLSLCKIGGVLDLCPWKPVGNLIRSLLHLLTNWTYGLSPEQFTTAAMYPNLGCQVFLHI